MADRARIIAAYERHEAARKARTPILDIADIRACVQATADECGVTYQEARDTLSAAWAGMQG